MSARTGPEPAARRPPARRRAAIGRWVACAPLLLASACSVPNGTNINAREAYWNARIAGELAPGATRGELERFARAHGETLDCYRNAQDGEQCDFIDRRSAGGPPNLPMQLAVIFRMKDGRYVSHLFATSHVEPR